MARYKKYNYGQMKLLPVSFERQILPGTFEHTLNWLIDEEFDLSVFESRYKNDETGAPTYDPAILLKIILLAYARGVTSSREIAGLCRTAWFTTSASCSDTAVRQNEALEAAK